MAAKTTANRPLRPRHLGLAGDLDRQPGMGKAGGGKDGQFLPLTMVFIPSIAEMPVWINSEG